MSFQRWMRQDMTWVQADHIPGTGRQLVSLIGRAAIDAGVLQDVVWLRDVVVRVGATDRTDPIHAEVLLVHRLRESADGPGFTFLPLDLTQDTPRVVLSPEVTAELPDLGAALHALVDRSLRRTSRVAEKLPHTPAEPAAASKSAVTPPGAAPTQAGASGRATLRAVGPAAHMGPTGR